MPAFLLPVLAALGVGYFTGTKNEPPQIATPANQNSGLNLTTVAGYVILGGLVYYFGKKIIK